MTHIVVERPNGTVTIVRAKQIDGSDNSLTIHEEIINELWDKLKQINNKTLLTCPSCNGTYGFNEFDIEVE